MFGQESTDVGNYLIAQWGVIGVALIVLSWLVVFFFRRILEENKALSSQRGEMIKTLLLVVPLLEKATGVLEIRREHDAEIAQSLRDIKQMLISQRGDRS